MKISKSDIIQAALIAGFYMMDGVYGQETEQLMPTSDYSTLEHFAKLVLEAAETMKRSKNERTENWMTLRRRGQ